MSGRKDPPFRALPRYKDAPDGSRRWLEYGEPTWDWFDWAASDRPDFRHAVEDLVEAGCDGQVLRQTLNLIHAQRETSSSRDELRHARAALDEGRHALLGLLREEDVSLEHLLAGGGPPITPREERTLLNYSTADADAALRILADLSIQLKKLQRRAHRRKSRVRDQHRAILVRYVKQQTGKLYDRLVCDLLNGAMAPEPEVHTMHLFPDEDPTGEIPKRLLGAAMMEREALPIWDGTSVEAHRRWRRVHKDLIEDPPPLEEQWREHLAQKEERPQPRPQELFQPSLRGRLRRNRRDTG